MNGMSTSRQQPDEKCFNCGVAVQVVTHLVNRRVACRRCHDLLQPQCPYCHEYVKRKKMPERRSSFRCKACGKQIEVDPNQWLYDRPYLTDEQAGYLAFLEQLDRWVFTLGSRDDYRRVQAVLRQKFGGEPGIGDVIWGLMNESQRVLGEKHNAAIEELRQLFDGRIPSHMSRSAGAKIEMQELQELMKEYRAFEREVKAVKKRRKQRPKG